MRPALSSDVQRKSIQVLVSSSLLLITGILFGYFIAIPGALQFLQEFACEYVISALTADAYLQFIVSYTLGLGLVFQLPLLLMLIHWIKPLTPGGLMKSERWIIMLSFVAAAIITPTPDPLNQTIIALPIILVYQLGVSAVLINIFKTKRKNTLARRRSAATATQPALQPSLPPLATPPLLASNTPVQTIPRLQVEAAPATHAFRSMDGFRAQPIANRQSPRPPVSLKQTTSPRQPSKHMPTVEQPVFRKHSPRFAIDGISPSFQISR